MKEEEKFALEWVGTKDVYEALRLETIGRVYSYKVTNRTLGKDKAPLCIELNKPPLDPAFEAEMKELRYAMLLLTIKTDLEKSHQNDPNCEVSASKDENGKEITDESEDEEDADTNDAEDADDEDDDDDDADDDDNQNGGNTNNDAAIPEESSSHNSSSRSDDKREASLKDDETSNTQPEDLSRAIVPHVQPMDETPIKRVDGTPRDDKMDASPILISFASGGKM
ncbi:PREDICTED: pheromone-processing carboxypeptidase KEX1-like [Ipomoea nil]|uniref:pheromone-processing carboxypeptidase KEX1-like n=1 Tax=Ipomoea nil TaxID=35883 RepID=UPI0009012E67|nr:PREDICTED: pheromone-processing carboxypeptidase KEX1-like [Ipomoea nil]